MVERLMKRLQLLNNQSVIGRPISRCKQGWSYGCFTLLWLLLSETYFISKYRKTTVWSFHQRGWSFKSKICPGAFCGKSVALFCTHHMINAQMTIDDHRLTYDSHLNQVWSHDPSMNRTRTGFCKREQANVCKLMYNLRVVRRTRCHQQTLSSAVAVTGDQCIGCIDDDDSLTVQM